MIELKGIICCSDKRRKRVDVIVCVDGSAGNERHRVGVDIQVSRGMILKFLASMYDVLPGDIVWPANIVL